MRVGPDSRYCGSHISVNLGQVQVHYVPNQTHTGFIPNQISANTHVNHARAFYIVSFDKSLLLGLARDTENSSQFIL